MGSTGASDDRVVIVGAGPTGLAMACELSRHGVPVRVIDQGEARSDRSKAVAVHARTLEMWEALGVTDAALAAGRRLHGANVYSGGRRVVHVGFDDIDTPHPYVLSLPQSATERILEEQALRLGATIERRVRLIGFEEEPGQVVVEVARGEGERETLRAPWVIGCDGGRSTVRERVGIPFDGARYAETFVLGDVTLDWALPDDEVHVFFAPEGLIGAIPLPGDGCWRVVADLGAQHAREGDVGEHGLDASAPPPRREELEALLRARSGMPLSMRTSSWTSRFRIHRRIVPTYRHGRVFLAGDAAHVHSPVGGQGMNTGQQDAFNLGWKLALVHRGLARPELLDSYSSERQPIAAMTLQGTDAATRVITLRNPIARELRDRIGAFLIGLEPVQKRMTYAAAELSLHYRKSPIVGEHRLPLTRSHVIADRRTESPSMSDWLDFGAGPAPGDRAPDVELSREPTEGRFTGSAKVPQASFAKTPVRGAQGPARLFELLRGTAHVLLLFDGAAATAEGYRNLHTIARAMAERYAPHVQSHVIVPHDARPDALGADVSVVLDAQRAVHRRYGAGSECAYLIRPDGYVAFRAQPAELEPLLGYLATIFV